MDKQELIEEAVRVAIGHYESSQRPTYIWPRTKTVDLTIRSPKHQQLAKELGREDLLV